MKRLFEKQHTPSVPVALTEAAQWPLGKHKLNKSKTASTKSHKKNMLQWSWIVSKINIAESIHLAHRAKRPSFMITHPAQRASASKSIIILASQNN